MLNLENHITLNKSAIESPNLCDRFSDADLAAIGSYVFESYQKDIASRSDWARRNEAGMKLAMQVQEEKSFPWTGCANVKFPLITIASLQFHARAYPAIIDGDKLVKVRVISDDPQGALQARADRISTHMSWQCLEQDEAWEEEEDRALLTVPIVGTVFKKSYYSAGAGHNISELVMPQDLIVNYWAKSIETAPVKTHKIPLFRNEIYSRVKAGTYRNILDEAWYKQDAPIPADNNRTNNDKRDGLTQPEPDQNTPFAICEQHCLLDLDGDGYLEPYIVTFEETTQTVLRIVTRFSRPQDIEKNNKGEIIRIHADEYFTKKGFIPSPDGALMDIGFGVLLGPLNESVDSAINQLFDSGTLATTAGGFLGRGAKIRGGIYSFDPFGWNRVDSSGDDLRKNIFPLPVREPSNVLFNLLELLIDYTNRISGATDTLTGIAPGQNTPAETNRSTVEQGQKIYSAIFKRIWRSLKQEFKKLYQLNAIYLPTTVVFGAGNSKISREDYTGDPGTVIPAADPNIISDAASYNRAIMVRNASMQNPGYNKDEVERMFLRALKIPNMDTLYPGLDKMPPAGPSEKIQIQQLKNQHGMEELNLRKMQFVMTLQEQRRMNSAKILDLMAKAEKYSADARNADANTRINAYNAAVNAIREENNRMSDEIDKILEEIKSNESTDSTAGSGGVPALEGPSGNATGNETSSANAGAS